MSRLDRFWTLVILLLVAVTVGGGLVAWSKYQPRPPLEITLPADEKVTGDILIGGAVTNPGYYPFNDSDSIEDLIGAAGGLNGNTDLTQLELYVPEAEAEPGPQKIDINRAEAWLLDALPNIGPSRAQAIVDYREQNGPFRSTEEITKVEGIGTAIYEQIKSLITVTGR